MLRRSEYPVFEVQVHQQLRSFLRQHPDVAWSHHLTFTRLIARAVRLDRSALIQTGTAAHPDAPYRLGYLLPLLLWDHPARIVAPDSVQTRLQSVEIPRLMHSLGHSLGLEPINSLQFVTPEEWLGDRLQNLTPDSHRLTLIDGVDDLETWTRNILNHAVQTQDWDDLAQHYPEHLNAIRDRRIHLTHHLFQRPANPHNCYLLEPDDRLALQDLLRDLHDHSPLPKIWHDLHDQLQTSPAAGILWGSVDRSIGHFTLTYSPLNIADALAPLWSQQTTLLIGSSLDLETTAESYRALHGLNADLTCLKFTPSRATGSISLYQPEGIPLPNTPQYQPALLNELHRILNHLAIDPQPGLTVILIGDTPLRAQIASALAAEWGSRVQVDRLPSQSDGILIAGWDGWQALQAGASLTPQAIVIATLPMPSLEHPLVAARVADYKAARRDWFRRYLLPQALRDLSRAVLPVRKSQGFVALLDSRVLHRNYGQQILTALSPYDRMTPALIRKTAMIGLP